MTEWPVSLDEVDVVGICRTTIPFAEKTAVLCVSSLQTNQKSNNLQVATELPLMLVIVYAPQTLLHVVTSFLHMDCMTNWN